MRESKRWPERRRQSERPRSPPEAAPLNTWEPAKADPYAVPKRKKGQSANAALGEALKNAEKKQKDKAVMLDALDPKDI